LGAGPRQPEWTSHDNLESTGGKARGPQLLQPLTKKNKDHPQLPHMPFVPGLWLQDASILLLNYRQYV
jgi:hypothetical protein